MQDNDEISVVRRWISTQRVDIGNQIAALRGKLSMLDQMEKELGKQLVAAPPPARRYRVEGSNSKAQAQALLALEAAGDKGLTSTQLAEVAQMPKGTASSRLMYMARDGLVRKIDKRYFVVHSTQEDNNADQSA
jgi:hypothetical protein